MKRILEVKGRTGRYDVPSFLWTENEPLTIEIKINESREGVFVAKAICGDEKKTVFLSETMSFDIPPEFIKNGGYNPVLILLEFRTVDLSRKLVDNDPTKGGYFIEPLYIEQVEENTTAYAWLEMTANAISKLNERIESIENKLSAFEDNGVPLIFENEEYKEQEEQIEEEIEKE